MLAVTVKRCGPTPIPAHRTYRPRKRQPSRRAERQNPHSGSTVALRGFVQDGFCNGCPLPAHAAIVLGISHHRNLNILRHDRLVPAIDFFCSSLPKSVDAQDKSRA